MAHTVWHTWLIVADNFLHMRRYDHGTSAVPETAPRAMRGFDQGALVPETLRGCPLTFNRCLLELVKHECYIQDWMQDTPLVQEQRVFAGMGEEARIVFCQCIVETWDSWFYRNVFILAATPNGLRHDTWMEHCFRCCPCL